VRNNTANPEVREGGGEKVLQVLGQRFPCSPWKFWERPWWSRYSPAAHGEDHAGADIHTVARG